MINTMSVLNVPMEAFVLGLSPYHANRSCMLINVTEILLTAKKVINCLWINNHVMIALLINIVMVCLYTHVHKFNVYMG